MSGFVYILKSDRGALYVGSTDNLTRRIRAHKSGHTKTTKLRRIQELVFSQEFETLEQARMIERKLKKLKRKDYLEKIIEDGYIKLANNKRP